MGCLLVTTPRLRNVCSPTRPAFNGGFVNMNLLKGKRGCEILRFFLKMATNGFSSCVFVILAWQMPSKLNSKWYKYVGYYLLCDNMMTMI